MSETTTGRRKSARQRRPPPEFNSSPLPAAKAAAAKAKAKRDRVDDQAEEAAAKAAVPRESDPSAFLKARQEPYGACVMCGAGIAFVVGTLDVCGLVSSIVTPEKVPPVFRFKSVVFV